jgi:hypothetical protein
MLDTTEYDPYSPKCLDDIVGNTDLWKALALQIKENKSNDFTAGIMVVPSIKQLKR